MDAKKHSVGWRWRGAAAATDVDPARGFVAGPDKKAHPKARAYRGLQLSAGAAFHGAKAQAIARGVSRVKPKD
jgi:hypothetical protein